MAHLVIFLSGCSKSASECVCKYCFRALVSEENSAVERILVNKVPNSSVTIKDSGAP